MARGPEEKNNSTITCGPTTLVKNHYSVPVDWVNLHELIDDLPSSRLGRASKAASPRRTCSPCQSSKWAKEEDGLFYLARSEYDLACGQV